MQVALRDKGAPVKRKKHVLTEDEYVQGIEAIIERDFFPDIPLLKQKLAFMKSQEKVINRAGVGELFTVAQPLSSVAGKLAPTPAVTGREAAVMETPIVASGDVQEVPDMEQEQDGSVPVAPRQSLDVFLSRFTSEDNASFSELQEETLNRKRLKVQHLLEFPKPSKADKVDGYIDWPFNPKNKLFYDSSVTGDVKYTESELAQRVQGPPREIRHENTRLPAEFGMELSEGLKPGVDYHMPGVGVVDKVQRSLLSTPTPVPGKNMTPIMTWGELAGTPIRLDRTPGFTIKAESDRDVIGRKMASSAKRSMQKRSARFTPASVRASPRTLSAAGKKLMSVLQKKTPGTDLQLRASYSGTPCRRSSRSSVRSATPIERKPKIKQETSQYTGAKLTDDLLD